MKYCEKHRSKKVKGSVQKIVCLVLTLGVLFMLSACKESVQEQADTHLDIDKYLEDGQYLEAYNAAEDNGMKDQIKAENFLAYACYDINVNVDSTLQLVGGAFGKATANTNDVFYSNDPITAIDNYGKLAEYVSMLTGKDVVNEYYYGVFEMVVENTTTKYGLASINIGDKKYKLNYTWDTLDQTTEDNDIESFYKYVARSIKENGTSIGTAAVERLNQKYLSASPQSVTFEFDLN